MPNESPSWTISALEGLSYEQAVALVIANPATRYKLRERIADDQERDPVDSLHDAEILLALQTLRVRDAMGATQAAVSRH